MTDLLTIEAQAQHIRLPQPYLKPVQAIAPQPSLKTEAQPVWERCQRNTANVFNVTCSVSECNYKDKNEIDWSHINYHKETTSIPFLANSILKNGYCITSIFKLDSFNIKKKTDANWLGSQFVIFDLDDIYRGTTLKDYLSYLSLKPTISYTTRNHNCIKPGDTKPFSRFRLIYIFDELIKSKELYQSIYDKIGTYFPINFTDPEGKPDDCGRSPVQLFSGNGYSNCEMYYDDTIIYKISYFTTTEEVAQNQAIHVQAHETNPEHSQSKKPEYTNKYNVDDEFLEDLYSMPASTFLGKYEEHFGGLLTHTVLDFNSYGYAFTPENYVETKPKYFGREVHKLQDGEGRRHKMFVDSKLRVQMKKDVCLEELIFNLAYDRFHYYDNKDKVLTNETLIRIAYNALNTDYDIKVKPSKTFKRTKFKVDPEYCKNNGIRPNGYKNIVRQILNFESIDEWYDPSRSLIDNFKFAKVNGIKVSKDTLYRYCKNRNINTKGENSGQDLSKPSAKQETKRKDIRANTLAHVDFTEYQKKCKLYNTVFCSESTNRKRIIYSYGY